MVKTSDAMGFCPTRGIVKIAVQMPIADFDELKRRAVKEGASLSAKIREYVHVGLAVDADCDGETWPAPKEKICMVDISRAPGLIAAFAEDRSECLEPSSLAAERGNNGVNLTTTELAPDIPQAAEAGCEPQ
jgi:hypothetical protein